MEILYTLFGYVMRFCCTISANNYILAIFFFSLIMQIILFPLGIKQQKNSVKTASLRPKEMAIRKKYAGRTDKATQQKMSLEINEMYQKEGYNPMSGCLPLFVQLPIIMVLYSIVRLPLTYGNDKKIITDSVRQELSNQAAVIATNQKTVLDILGEKNSDDYAEAEKLITNIKAGDESQVVRSLKYTSESFIEQYIAKDNSKEDYYSSFAMNNYKAYVEVTKEFGEYIYFCPPVADSEGEILKIQEDKVEADKIDTLNTLEMCSFSEKISTLENSVENKLGYSKIVKESKINLEEDLPNFKFLGKTTLLDQPDISEFSPILLIPLLVFVTSFAGSEITRKFAAPAPAADGQNPNNNIVLRVGMPLLSAWFALKLSAAVGLYWIYRSILSAIQQIILSKMYPIPTFSKEEMKAAEEEIIKKRKRKKIIMIEVDEDDTSFDSLIISEEKAEKIRKRHEKALSEEKQVAVPEEKKFIDKAPLKKSKKDKDDEDKQ